MQFKHPELLWALFLLLIPIFIHLFRLRRFKKTPFTNVKFLKEVVSESRKSKSLKKWLLLFTRMLLLAALIIAFAQPFFANDLALKKRETIIYLDNSFSMQAKVQNTTLLENAVQELLKQIPPANTFSLFTNNATFKNVTLKEVQNDLLSLSFTQKQLRLPEIQLKANALASKTENKIQDIILISDFQQRMTTATPDTLALANAHLITLSPGHINNIAIDSAYINLDNSNNLELSVLLSGATTEKNIPVSLFDNDKLIAKTSAIFNGRKKSEVVFSLPNNVAINGKIEINDTSLSYDNSLYFNIDKKEKIKVLAIGEANSGYLSRIYTEDEFLLLKYDIEKLNYSVIESQNLIVLNELNIIPSALQSALHNFVQNGGSLAVIPSTDMDIASYDNLVSKYFTTSFIQKREVSKEISDITFEHPLYKNVFEKKISNFQYPKVSSYYEVRSKAPKILSYTDESPFLLGANGTYIFTAAINLGASTFKNSPLIVPTLYNMGLNSLRLPKLYTQIGANAKVDVPITLLKDEIVKISNTAYEFIPQQTSNANKVSLYFNENPIYDGIYQIKNREKTIGNIGFNHTREESSLAYIDVSTLKAKGRQNSITALFYKIENEQSVNELWKWFAILALCFIVIEVLLQKFLK